MAATARRILPARLEGQSAAERLELKSACARFEVKSVSDDGTFEGYASLFNREDLGHDVIQPGAFRESLIKRGASKIKMLFQHNPSELIGVWDEVREDERGLYVKGRLMLAVAKAREVLALMRAGALDGLSIGFKAEKARRESRSGVRRIEKIDLWEISVVTFPMLPEARVAAVKSGASGRLDEGESDAPRISEREFERWLTRERKLSRSEARAVMRSGFAGLKAARERAQSLRGGDHGLLAAALRRAARVMRTETTALAFDQQNAATLKSSWLKVKSEIEYVRMLAAARTFAAALHREQKYSPDQPRVPAGNSDGGQWTDGGGGGTSRSIEGILREPNLASLLQNVAYPGDFHDVVRDYLVNGLRKGGAIIETEVTLILPGNPPVEARIDILGRAPNGLLFGIDVKTGDNPKFTPGQVIVYPHAIGGAGVISYDSKIQSLGLTPGRPLPAFAIDAVYTSGYGQPMKVVPLPAEPK